MKKMSYFVVTFLIAFSFMLHPNASIIIIVNGTEVTFRAGPTTASDNLASFDYGIKLDYIESAPKGAGCKAPWYKVNHEGQIGYICSEFVSFPESYIPLLTKLQKSHPNWDFIPMQVNIDFDKILQLEYDGHAKGWSLIEDFNNKIDGYKSTDPWSYNYKTNIFNNSFTGGGSGWYAANKQTIGYYLDPRNFLNNERIFMFETLSYNKEYHTREGINLMLKGTFMENGIADPESGKTYADAFYDSAIQNNISPYVLIGRVIQEVNSKGSTIVSGTVPGYEGYYNFYNIGATGETNSIIRNGLEYAKRKGWNTPYKAIVGGANFLNQGYISKGQDTLYLQKWDLIPPTYVNHQYMQNIQAPYSESINTYANYNDLGLLNGSFAFRIPVFKSMPDKTSLPNSGNPNNYLSSLSVNGNYLFKEPTDETNFRLNLSEASTSIDIAATKVARTSSISGTGSVSLTKTIESIPIKVTAANGDIRTYTIKVSRDGNISLDISEILRVLNIKNDGKYIYGIQVGTNITEILNKIKNQENRATITAFDKNGKAKKDGCIASGDTVNIKTDREEKNYTIAIRGDGNGDGKIDKLDAVAVLRDYYGYEKQSGINKKMLDVNGDNKIDKLDAHVILRDYYGYEKIKQ